MQLPAGHGPLHGIARCTFVGKEIALLISLVSRLVLHIVATSRKSKSENNKVKTKEQRTVPSDFTFCLLPSYFGQALIHLRQRPPARRGSPENSWPLHSHTAERSIRCSKRPA